MDHPCIAKVLDAGATDTGRPFFVMELVRGVPITQYCDECKLDVRQRLISGYDQPVGPAVVEWLPCEDGRIRARTRAITWLARIYMWMGVSVVFQRSGVLSPGLPLACDVALHADLLDWNGLEAQLQRRRTGLEAVVIVLGVDEQRIGDH